MVESLKWKDPRMLNRGSGRSGPKRQWKTLRGSGPKRQWKTLMGSGKPAGKIEKEKDLSLRACAIMNVKTYNQERES